MSTTLLELNQVIGGAVYYCSAHPVPLFELALFANGPDAKGERHLATRLRKRFGRDNVKVHKEGPAATVIHVFSEPLAKQCGFSYIAGYIADIARQHYGGTIEVDIATRREPICNPRFRTKR